MTRLTPDKISAAIAAGEPFNAADMPLDAVFASLMKLGDKIGRPETQGMREKLRGSLRDMFLLGAMTYASMNEEGRVKADGELAEFFGQAPR